MCAGISPKKEFVNRLIDQIDKEMEAEQDQLSEFAEMATKIKQSTSSDDRRRASSGSQRGFGSVESVNAAGPGNPRAGEKGVYERAAE